MLGIDAVQPRAHQRLAETRAPNRRIAADDREIPVRLLGMLGLHHLADLLGRLSSATGMHQMKPGIISSPSSRDCFHRPGGSHSVAAPIVGRRGDFHPTAGQEVMPRHRREHAR